jgi:ABC-type sugar transport system ATPase subunit
VIYTSSDPRDAFALGDQVLLLEQNRKLQAGTPLQVYQHPANLAAAHLMSDPGVNRLPLIKQDDGATCRAVRPEHIRLGSEPPPSADTELNIDMRVDSVERSGDETFLHGTVFDPQYPGATEHWVVRRPGMHSVDVGQVLALYVRHDDILTLVED